MHRDSKLTKIYDMAYSVEDDAVTIEQDTGAGEVNTVWLHPIHIRLLATEMGMLKGDLDQARRVGTLERRLRLLRDRIKDLDQLLWSVPSFPPDSTSEDCILSSALLDLANEFCAEFEVTESHPCQPVTGDTGAVSARGQSQLDLPEVR